jgi:hypothetical protein
MAKKKQRNVSRGSAAPRGNAPVAASTPVERPTSYSPSRRSAVVEFNPDYTHIINDLKRVGTLAGLFFIVLIILSFILR